MIGKNKHLTFDGFRIIIPGILLLVIISGCINKTEKNKNSSVEEYFFSIDIPDALKHRQDIPVSQIAKDITYIPLETTKNSLLGGRISDVKFSNEYIFIHHNGSPLLTLYNWNGKFVRHIGTVGRGPAEYLLMREFTIDEKNRLIYIQPNYVKKMLVFSFDGEYIRSISYDGVEWGHAVWIRDSCFLNFSSPEYGKEAYIFIETNSKGDTLQTVRNHYFWDAKQSSHFMISGFQGRNVFYMFNNKLHFKGWYNDTVYTYNQNFEIIPYFFVDLKELKLPDELRIEKKSTHEILQDREHYWTGVKESLKYIFIKFGTYDLNISDNGFILYEKGSRETLTLNHNTGFYNDLNGGPDFYPQFINDTMALQLMEAFEFKDYCLSDKFRNSKPANMEQKENLQKLNNILTENDNHVLVIARLKAN